MGLFIPALGEKGEVRTPLASAVFEVSLAQTNPQAKSDIFQGDVFCHSSLFFLNNHIYLWPVLGPHCCMGFSLAAERRAAPQLQCEGLALPWLLLLRHGPWCVGFSNCSMRVQSLVGTPGLQSTLSSCGALVQLLHSMQNPQDQGSNPCLRHWH